MDATDRINDLINITGRLVTLLEGENAALVEDRHQDISLFLEEKSALSRAYETRVEGLKETSGDLSDVDEDLRERLRGLGEKVKTLMDDNSRHLKVAIEVNKRVMGAIAGAAKAHKAGPGLYSAKGSSNAKGRESASESRPVSIDKSL